MKDWVKSFRVKDWLHYLGFVLIGYFFGKNFNFFEILFLLFLSAFLLAFAYSYNEYKDKKLKQKTFFLPLIANFSFFPFLSTFRLIVGSFFIFLFWIYSKRFSKIPIVCTLINAIGFPLLFLLGTNSLTLNVLLFFLLLCLVSLIAQLIHEMLDEKEDKLIGRKTTAILLGKDDCAKVSRLIFWASFIYTAFLTYSLRLLSLFSLLPIFLFFLVKRWEDLSEIRNDYRKAGILVGCIILLELLIKRMT